MRFRFVCASCGARVVYRDRFKGYVHLDGRTHDGSTVAHDVRSETTE